MGPMKSYLNLKYALKNNNALVGPRCACQVVISRTFL